MPVDAVIGGCIALAVGLAMAFIGAKGYRREIVWPAAGAVISTAYVIWLAS